MKIISTNIAEPRIIKWNGREVETGIYKLPVETPLFLGLEDVRYDHVMDRRYHGGKDKACYLYSADHYPYWQNLYPQIDWQWGMFGENLTVSGLNESMIRIGDTFQTGEAVVQVTQPRQPCFKLGVRFGSQEIVKQFSLSDYPGIYVRILKEGFVSTGDSLILLESFSESPSIKIVFNMLYYNTFEKGQVAEVIKNPFLAQSCRKDLMKKWRITENPIPE